MIALTGAGYRYPSADRPALAGVDLRVEPGQIVLLTGPTGCGKSTLARLAVGLLARHGRGEVSGQVRVDGVDPAEVAPHDRVTHVGFVGQEPADQLIAGTVGDEIAFGPESAGWEAAAIDARIAEVVREVGLDVGSGRDTAALSGGQQQRLVVGAALAARARALVLDEPLAQLDPLGAVGLLQRLRALCDAGVAVLLVEHRIEACLPYADRLVVMDAGRIVLDVASSALDVGSEALAVLRALGLSVPGLLDLRDRLYPRPVEAIRLAAGWRRPRRPDRPIRIEATGLSYAWPGPVQALRGVDVRARAGERVALLGANGSGKSTLLAALAGQVRAGRVRVDGRVVAVPQDPDLALIAGTVRAELQLGPRELRLRDAEGVARRAAEALSVSDLLDRAPQALSRGQRLRVAVAAALACQPGVLLLDEPTSGQDHDQVEAMMSALADQLGDGVLVFATHDVGLALRWAHRVVVLREGEVVAHGSPRGASRELPALGMPVPPLLAVCLEYDVAPGTAEQIVARCEGAS